MAIFLTGSTGFVGGRLLKNLLNDTDQQLFVLVRNMSKGEELVQTFPEEQQKRITLLRGDITAPEFGLTSSTLSMLQNQIQTFYHLAAVVKFDEHLRDEIFSANYDGTKNTLKVAHQLRAKRFVYVSTAYTVGKREKGIEQLYPIDDDVHNPYEESKVQSEHLVFDYKEDMEVIIFRPAIIVGDSKTGEADSKFTLYGFMRALDVFKRRVARKHPEATYRLIGDERATSNVVPVDYVANILALGATSAKPNTIYHITNPQPTNNFKSLQFVKDALDFPQLEIIQPHEADDLTETERALNDMIGVFKPYLTRDFVFDDSNTQQLIEGTSIEHLSLDDETYRMIIEAYFQAK